jgi:hypothetical protein
VDTRQRPQCGDIVAFNGRCPVVTAGMAHKPPRRGDREPLNQVAGTPATVPTATGDIRNTVESLTREPTDDEIARRVCLHL